MNPLMGTCSAVVIMWVLCELAKRPEYIQEFRADTFTETGEDGVQRLTYASLQNAERLDSFIREVMRTKGDTLSTVRQTVSDTALAGYVIPKGVIHRIISYSILTTIFNVGAGSFVIPLATLANEDETHYGENAKMFVGDRWVGTGKPATMVSPNYFPFGLGRWACPGRGLAVAGKYASDLKRVVLNAHVDARDQAVHTINNCTCQPLSGGWGIQSR